MSLRAALPLSLCFPEFCRSCGKLNREGDRGEKKKEKGKEGRSNERVERRFGEVRTARKWHGGRSRCGTGWYACFPIETLSGPAGKGVGGQKQIDLITQVLRWVVLAGQTPLRCDASDGVPPKRLSAASGGVF